MLIIVFGAVLLGTEKLNTRKIKDHLSQEVVMALLAAIFLGVDIFFLNMVVDELPWETITGLTAVSAAIYVLTLSFLKNKSATIKSLRNLRKNKIGIASGLTLTLGAIGFFVGSEISGNLIIPAVIASASVLVTSLLAAIFDKEKIIITKRAGAVLVVVGVVMLNIN
ncbi:EamA family transporter [Candidatus Parcubacteria bacterium]|nr:EamA family transporter [Candidatus Parcubacteria bacterium]